MMLEQNGFLIFSIAKECPRIKDEEVIQIANQNQGFIMTEDKDFADILVYKAPILWVPALLLRFYLMPIPAKKCTHIFRIKYLRV